MVLNKILTYKRKQLGETKRLLPLSTLRSLIAKGKKSNHAFYRALSKTRITHLICELKKASPSAGVLKKQFNPSQLVLEFEKSGASALSVLTEDRFFQGSPDIFRVVRKETRLPLLRKDFFIDPYQIYESAYLGADAVLLIVTILNDRLLKTMIRLANTLGLDALVEVHSENELRRALRAGAKMIGINNRNLKTLNVRSDFAEKIIPKIANDVLVIVESGIERREQIERYERLGVRSFLVGTALMKSKNIRSKIKELKGL